MKIYKGDTYGEMSQQAAKDLLEMIQSKKNPLLCTASGDSPKRLYKELIRQVKEKNIDILQWNFLSLDEWAGMNGKDEGSCRFHLDNDLFGPLAIPVENITFFDGRAADQEQECERIENYIREQGGIDAAIVGLGMNGHVGMNEPGTAADSRTHVAEIDAITQTVGQKYFTKEQPLTHGITLGLATLLEAKNIMLVVSGRKKAPVVKKILEEEISENLPASILRRHPHLFVYLDKEAASELDPA